MGEKPSGFTELEHYHLLRTSPAYGLWLQMDELAMQQEPSLSQDTFPRETIMITQKETSWSNRQWEAVKELKGMVLFLQRKVNDSLKRKETYLNKKANRYAKYT